MEVIIRPDAAAASDLVARIVAAEIRAKPSIVLGLATGRTMDSVYQRLLALRLDFSRCRTFNLDEYVGLPGTDARSYRAYMNNALFKHVNINLANTHVPDGIAADLDAECQRYEDAIRQAGGIDLQLLGLGKSGHIGFNEPLSALLSRTRVKALTPTTIAQNADFFGGPANVPRRAITMGVGTIADSRRCVMLVTGESKAEIVAQAVEGPITSMISATALQLHRRCVVVVDEGAASRLTEKDYYRWIFDNEPEWEPFRKA
jgi:glucosamine-6-phosphate deaminase